MLRLLLRLSLLIVVLATVAVAFGGWLIHRPLSLQAEVVEFAVPKGSGMRQAAERIAEAGVELNPFLFSLLARLSGHAHQIKAGSYEVAQGITPWQLMLKLSSGDVSQTSVLFVEGWTFSQLRGALENNPALEADTVGLSDAEVLARIGATEKHAEGLFLPDTYLTDRRAPVSAVLKRAYEAMQRHLREVWATRAPNLPLKSSYELLILASIVEKETGREADRPLVASVFANRLRIGMPLQTDPTVIYGLGSGFDGRLRRMHLTTDHPWNTYTRPGLPPTPIAMPGVAALRAAVQPQPSDYLYFVARGDGSSHFSPSLDEHNRAVNKYQRGGGGN